MNISPKDFSMTVSQLLDDYGQDVRKAVNESILEVGKQTLRTVKKNSPKRRRGGKYRRGWKIAEEKTGVGKRNTSITIYNKNYRLPHLLENGHQKVNGGRVEGQPHIWPAYKEALRLLDAKVKQSIEEAGG